MLALSLIMNVSPIRFDDFTSRLLRLYEPPLRTKATFYAMRAAIRSFAEVPGVQTTADFTTDQVAKYIQTRKDLNVNSTLSRLRAIKTASLYAHAEGWLERLPQWRRLFPRASPAVKRVHFTHDQVVRLLSDLEAHAVDWKGRRLHAITATVAYTGLRKNECLFLWKTDVDLLSGVIHVDPRRRLKTESSAAPVPIPDGLSPILARWIPETETEWLFPGVEKRGPWSQGAPGYRPLDKLKEAAARAHIEGVTFHGLRHTLAKLYISRFGGTADQAKSLLRHSDVRTTEEHYLHRDDVEQLRSIGRRIEFDLPGTATGG